MNTQSQIFDFSRFADCLNRDLTLNGKSWMLKGLMMLGVTSLLLFITTNPGMHVNISEFNYVALQREGCFLTFRFCGSAFCALGASLFMENMTNNGLRLNSLMSPASNLEKFISRFIICVLGVTIAFLICFAIADAIRVLTFSTMYDDIAGLSYMGPFKVQVFAEKKSYLWGFFIAFQATFVLGSTVWPKNSFLKTFGTLIVLAIVFLIAGNYVYSWVREPGLWPSFDSLGVIDTMLEILPFLWTIFCYITAYYRFKESEIINRY